MGRLIICMDCGERKEYYAKERCKPCYQQWWQEKNPEKMRANRLRYYYRNREKCLAYIHCYQQENPEKTRRRSQRYREKHPGKTREAWRHWREKNRQKYLAGARRYREENPERVKRATRRWREENPDKVRLSKLRRRARKKSLPATLTPQQRKQKLSIGHCFYCGEEAKLTLDHFVPLAANRNGACGTTLANTVVACHKCNNQKHTKMPKEILKQLAFI